VKGASVSDLIVAKDAALDMEIKGKLDATMAKMAVLVSNARGGEAYDQMIGEGNKKVMDAIDALVDQTWFIEKEVAVLGLSSLEIEGSDGLDAPEKVGAGG